MKKTITTLLAAAAIVLGQTACTGRSAQQTGTQEKAENEAVVDNNEATTADEAPAVAAEGEMAPDFTLQDINGQPLTLSSLRGKYVILDFWGSWCPWCIRGIPKMKEYYAKYKDKVEIVGIDCKESEDEWKASVKENEIPWLHVYNPTDDDSLQRAYALEGYPHKVVISPEGRVMKMVVGEDPAFYDYLDETLGS